MAPEALLFFVWGESIQGCIDKWRSWEWSRPQQIHQPVSSNQTFEWIKHFLPHRTDRPLTDGFLSSSLSHHPLCHHFLLPQHSSEILKSLLPESLHAVWKVTRDFLSLHRRDFPPERAKMDRDHHDMFFCIRETNYNASHQLTREVSLSAFSFSIRFFAFLRCNKVKHTQSHKHQSMQQLSQSWFCRCPPFFSACFSRFCPCGECPRPFPL